MRERGIRQADHWSNGGEINVAWRSHCEVPPRSSGAVTHQFAALAYYTGGNSRVEQGAQWTLREGDVLLVPAGQPHRHLESEGGAFWGVGFCVSCFASEDAGSLLTPFERVRGGASAVVHIPKDRRPYLQRLMEELQSATSREGAGASPRAVQRSLLTLILHEVQRAARWRDDPEAPAGIVAEALRFIERNCLRKLTLSDVARAVGRSPAHVTTAVSRATGRSVVEWMTAGRMAEARRLLLHSDERMDLIASRVGYADVTHFIRMFRRAHGVTPAAWRTAQTTTAKSGTEEVSPARPTRRARRPARG